MAHQTHHSVFTYLTSLLYPTPNPLLLHPYLATYSGPDMPESFQTLCMPTLLPSYSPCFLSPAPSLLILALILQKPSWTLSSPFLDNWGGGGALPCDSPLNMLSYWQHLVTVSGLSVSSTKQWAPRKQSSCYSSLYPQQSARGLTQRRHSVLFMWWKK